jgi:hypothetical protein
LLARSPACTSCASTGPRTAPSEAPRPGHEAAAADREVAAALDGYRWDLPCDNPDPTMYKPGGVCRWDPALLARGSADDTWKLKIEETKTLGRRVLVLVHDGALMARRWGLVSVDLP